MAILFDESRHVYLTEDGRAFPGITSVLRRAGLLPEFQPPQSAFERGTRVHMAIAYDLDGDLDEHSVDPSEFGYVVAARNARRELGIEIEKGRGEHLVVNELYGYGTAIDAVGRWRGKRAIVNWKSGMSDFHHYRIQSALEALCLREPHARLYIHLHDDGKYRLNEHKDRKDFDVARAALTIVGWKKENANGSNNHHDA